MKKFLVSLAVASLWAWSALAYVLNDNALRGNAPDGTPIAIQFEDVGLGFMANLLYLDREINTWRGLWFSDPLFSNPGQTIESAGGAGAYVLSLKPQVDAALKRKWPGGTVVTAEQPPSTAPSTNPPTPDGVIRELSQRFVFKVNADGTVTFSPR